MSTFAKEFEIIYIDENLNLHWIINSEFLLYLKVIYGILL